MTGIRDRKAIMEMKFGKGNAYGCCGQQLSQECSKTCTKRAGQARDGTVRPALCLTSARITRQPLTCFFAGQNSMESPVAYRTVGLSNSKGWEVLDWC